MNQTAELIKRAVPMERAAEYYGFHPNRGGYIPCPFHQEKTASLKVYTDQNGHSGWHCFGCGRGGSVIDFVMALFGINYRQAVLRISRDFSLGLAEGIVKRSELSLAVRKAQQARRDAERREDEWWAMIRELWYCREIVKEAPPVLDGDSIWFHPFYLEAIRLLPKIENWLDQRFQEGDNLDWKNCQSTQKTTS